MNGESSRKQMAHMVGPSEGVAARAASSSEEAIRGDWKCEDKTPILLLVLHLQSSRSIALRFRGFGLCKYLDFGRTIYQWHPRFSFLNKSYPFLIFTQKIYSLFKKK